MKLARDLLVLAALVLMCFVMAIVAFHVPGWARGVDNGLAKFQTAAGSMAEAADTSNLASTQALDLIGSTTKLVDHTTKRVDELHDVLGKISAAIESTNVLLAGVKSNVNDMSVEAGQTLYHLSTTARSLDLAVSTLDRTIADADELVTSPQIPEMLENTVRASANVNQTTAHLERTADNIQNYVQRATKPASAVKSFFLTILGPTATYLGTHF